MSHPISTAVQRQLADFDPQATYDAAAEDYARASAVYWTFIGEETVARLRLRPGESVLDVACGPGSSAIPAAEQVKPGGSVIALDLAENMLAVARARASARGLSNIEFHAGDMTKLDLPHARFDAVICVLGLFFVPDMPATLASFWRLLRPGGRLGVAVLGEHFFAPMYDVWKAAVGGERADLQISPPWERTHDPATLRSLLAEAGIAPADVSAEDARMPLRSPDDWWQIVMGTGLRRTVIDIGPEAASRVREHNLAYIRGHAVTHVVLSAIYAAAEKRGDPSTE